MIPYDDIKGYWPRIEACKARLQKAKLAALEEAFTLSGRYDCYDWKNMSEHQVFFMAYLLAERECRREQEMVLASAALAYRREFGCSKAEAAHAVNMLARELRRRCAGGFTGLLQERNEE